MRTILPFVLSILAGVANAQIQSLETEGNLEPTQNPGCVSLPDAGNELTPADLGLGVLECFDNKDDETAIRLFVLLQLRARFDALRVEDVSARAAQGALPALLRNEAGPEWDVRMQRAITDFRNEDGIQEICQVAKVSGPPEYYPRYMVQHGLAAFRGFEGDGLIDDFDPDATWQELLSSYLRCE